MDGTGQQQAAAPLPTLGMKTFGGVGVDYWGAVLIAAAVGTVALVYLWFVFLKWRAGRGRMTSVAAGQLRLAATRGRVQDLALLARLPDFQVDADLLGFTPLHAACVQGHPGAVVWLLQRGADLARLKQDGWRDTALHYAAGSGSMDCVQALLAWGADATLANALGALPADVAEKARHHSLAGYLRSVAAAATATAAQATAAGAADSSSSSASGAEPGNANGEGGHESTEGSGASAAVAAADEGAAGNAGSSPNLPEIPSKEELIKRHIMDPFRAARARFKQSKLDLLAEFTEAGEAVAKAEEASPVQDSPAPGSQATGPSQASVAPGREAAASTQASAAIVTKAAGAARGGEASGRGSTAAERERNAALQRLVQRGFEGLGTPGTVPKRETRLFRPLAVLTQFLGGAYLVWRALRTLRPGLFYLYSIPFWLAEFLAYCMSYCFVTSLFNMIERPERRVREMLPPERIPHVDVFICTYSEPVDIVEPTAVAALNMNWPGTKLTVHILDDSNRPEMARLVCRLTFQCKCMHREASIVYVARQKAAGVPHHAKAGNINSCLLKEGAKKGEFVLVLDCDMTRQQRPLAAPPPRKTSPRNLIAVLPACAGPMSDPQGSRRPRRAASRPARLGNCALGEELEGALGDEPEPAFSMGVCSPGSPHSGGKRRKGQRRAAARPPPPRARRVAAAPPLLWQLLGIEATVAGRLGKEAAASYAAEEGSPGEAVAAGADDGGKAEASSPVDGEGGSGGGKKRKRGYLYTEEERAGLAGKVHGKLEDLTLKNYTSHLKKLKAFCDMEGIGLGECESATEAAAVMGRIIDWAGLGMPGFDYARKKEEMSLGLLRQVRNVCVFVYDALCTHKGWDSAPELRYHRCFTVELKSAKKAVRPKRARVVGDPQENTTAGVVTREEHIAVARHFFIAGGLTDARNLAVILMNAHGCGRFSDATQFNLADLAPPVLLSQIGPCAALLYPCVLRGGKATSAGQVEMMCLLRHKEALVCGVRGVSWTIFRQYDLEGSPMPDISTDDGMACFYQLAAFPANGMYNNLQYKELYDPLKKAFLLLGILSFHITHYGRVFCANQLQMAGVPAAETAGLGRWKGGQGGFQAMNTSYMLYPSPAALCAAGWHDMDAHTSPKEAYWQPRFCMEVPGTLLAKVFAKPLRQLQHGINRLIAAGKKVPKAAANVVLALRGYRTVLVQDALELAPQFPDDPVIQWFNKQAEFRHLLAKYQRMLSAGEFRRPNNAHQDVKEMKRGFAALARFVVSGGGGAQTADLQQTIAAFEEEEQLYGTEAMLQHAAVIAGLERDARQAAARLTAGTPAEVAGAPAWEEAAQPALLQQLAEVAEAVGAELQRPRAQQQQAAAAAALGGPAALPAVQQQQHAAAAALGGPAALPAVQQQQHAAAAALGGPAALPAVQQQPMVLQQPIGVAPVVGAWATTAVADANAANAGLSAAMAQVQAAVQSSAANAAEQGPAVQALVAPLLSAVTQVMHATGTLAMQQQNALAALLATQGLHAAAPRRSAGSLTAAAQGLLGLDGSESDASAGMPARQAGGRGSRADLGSSGTDTGGAGSGGGAGNGSGVGAAELDCNIPSQLHLLGSATRMALLYYKGEGVYPAWKEREAQHDSSWRPGRSVGKIWSKIKVGIELVELLATERKCKVEAAALEWDRALAASKSQTGVATMCRTEERTRLLAMVGL